MRSIKLLLFFPLFLSLFFIQCKNDPEPAPVPEPTSTWGIIQAEIFEANCNTCHVAGTSFATQSDLVLTKDEAYEQLIDRVPHNEAAKNDGLLLVGTKGLESLYTSFLWEKINAPDQEHFYDDHPEYGDIMPFGSQPLTNGQLEYIRAWIVAGAPETGIVADAELLKDTSRFELPVSEFEALEMPASGYQLHVGPFPVIPNYEREFFYYQALNNPDPIYVNRVQVRMRPGSHHFILYDFLGNSSFPPTDQYRDLRDETGEYNVATVITLLNQVFFYGTQWRETDYRFPDGVALKLGPNRGFDLNSHYVNRTNDTTVGEVYSNIHTIPQSEVQHEAENLFLSYENLSLPSGQYTTVKKTWKFDEKRNVFMLTSHAHEHMTEFKIFISGGARDNELVFYANDWEHPPLAQFDPPMVLNAGEGLRAEATYYHEEGRTLEYGLLSEDEMMIIFGAFYRD